MIEFDLGNIIYDFFSVMGVPGLLLCIFLLFYIDAILIPTLPELFTVIIFMAIPEPWFAGLILFTIAGAEFLGLTTLYTLVKSVKVPRKIEAAVIKYRDFLIVRDERMIIVNRFAPVLPFMGAFVAICGWSYRKAVIYTLASGVIKYGAILALSNLFFVYFSEGTAGMITIIMVLIILVLSLIVSVYRRSMMKKEKLPEGVCPLPDADPSEEEA
ncbi:MAG: hypothetical protein GKC03_07130 [Methanomassiliicoccales archaeon]|nr:hypothetical protein [Methanomassiliicoccales archaeon]NYT14656.1 hypothetical protein [Methanomassiliicoccales archaeon]